MITEVEIGATKKPSPVFLNLPKLLAARMLIQADSGGGKSRMIRLLAELLMSTGRQVIVIDPEGEFATLREQHDLLIVGGDESDAQITPSLAAPLVQLLAETRASCVIDLEPLDPVERHQFVRDFAQSQLKLPRPQWGECYILLDEAPMFAPERGRGEACSTESVIAWATRGRKRGLCLIPATQRFSMLHKDVAALCSNVLIGPTTPNDTRRAAELAGVEMRNRSMFTKLNPRKREWIGRGPAFGTTDVIFFEASPHETTHPEPGQMLQVVKASARISDLAPKLAKLAATSKKEIGVLAVQTSQADIETALSEGYEKGHRDGYSVGHSNGREYMWIKCSVAIEAALKEAAKCHPPEPSTEPVIFETDIKPSSVPVVDTDNNARSQLNSAQKRIVDALAWWHSIGVDQPSMQQVGYMAKINPAGGHFSNTVGPLSTQGIIERNNGVMTLTDVGRGYAEWPECAGSLREYQNGIISVIKKKRSADMLREIIKAGNRKQTTEQIGKATGIDPAGGHFSNTIGPLSTMGLIQRSGGTVTPTELLFPRGLR